MGKRIIGRERTVEALAGLCKDYRGTALKAIRQGGEEVYVPAQPNQHMIEALENPDGLFQMINANGGTEPVYITEQDVRSGRNADGTPHAGYAVIDIVAKLVTDLRRIDGVSVVPNTRPITSGNLIRELTGRPESYCL